MALKWHECFPDRGLLLWGRREESLIGAKEALPENCLTTDLARISAEADLIILATPVGSMSHLVELMLESGLRPGAVISDVGSVKSMVHREIEPLLAGTGVEFVGSHPMAGSEKAGFSAARADLFEGAACVITGESSAQSAVLDFWTSLGCNCYVMSPEEHDAAVARVSHLPHVMASCTALSALSPDPKSGAIAGGGLRDTTRVASGDAQLWAEILSENRDALRGPLQDSINHLREVLDILDANDQERLTQWLHEAKLLRDSLDPISPSQS